MSLDLRFNSRFVRSLNEVRRAGGFSGFSEYSHCSINIRSFLNWHRGMSQSAAVVVKSTAAPFTVLLSSSDVAGSSSFEPENLCSHQIFVVMVHFLPGYLADVQSHVYLTKLYTLWLTQSMNISS